MYHEYEFGPLMLSHRVTPRDIADILHTWVYVHLFDVDYNKLSMRCTHQFHAKRSSLGPMYGRPARIWNITIVGDNFSVQQRPLSNRQQDPTPVISRGRLTRKNPTISLHNPTPLQRKLQLHILICVVWGILKLETCCESSTNLRKDPPPRVLL